MILYIIIGILIIIADLTTKSIVASTFSPGQQKLLIRNILSFVYVQNKGAAFGMLSGARIFFIVLTFVVFVAGFFYFRKNPIKSITEKLAVTFVAGGAVGNLCDRAYLGYVRDFISADFIDFPVFNIADCFICIGAFLYIMCILFENKNRDTKEK